MTIWFRNLPKASILSICEGIGIIPGIDGDGSQNIAMWSPEDGDNQCGYAWDANGACAISDYRITEAQAQWIEAQVQNGGTLVKDGKAGILREGGLPKWWTPLTEAP